MLEVLFWLFIFFIVYTYFGYPILLIFISLFKNIEIQKSNKRPFVTLIITAYNEEKKISNKLKKTLSLSYPKNKLQIIVASDCSNDNTDHIVKSFESEGIILVRSSERNGKEYAQKLAIEKANGDILIFSDVATILKKDAIEDIVSNFNNPSIGCVSSTDKIISDDGKITGENFYIKYEMFLRKLESNVNSLVGLSGSFFAARKEVCKKWRDDLQSDFNTLLNSIKMGLKGVIDTDSIGYYNNLKSYDQEFNRKIRTVLRGITVLMSNKKIMNPFKYGFFSFQIISHKLFRWLIPFILLYLFIANILLAFKSSLYTYLLIFQLAFYIIALAGFFCESLTQKNIFKIPFYFISINFSILIAWFMYINGRRLLFWEPSKR